MRKVLEHCPSCGGNLEITPLNCTSCETIVLGRYKHGPLCRLSPETTESLLTLVRSRGNVKETEKVVSLSIDDDTMVATVKGPQPPPSAHLCPGP